MTICIIISSLNHLSNQATNLFATLYPHQKLTVSSEIDVKILKVNKLPLR